MSFNGPNDRTFVYEDSPLQFTQGGNKRLLLLKNWNFAPNMSDFDIDRIDTAKPIYTKKSDVLGTFSFESVNTVDLYEDGSVASPTTYAFWALQIAAGTPVEITILLTMKAPNSTGDKLAKILFKGRIMSCPQNRSQDAGTHTFTVNGEITEITSIDRSAS